MIAGVDVILDMGGAMVNVAGGPTGTAVAAESEGELDHSEWANPPGPAPHIYLLHCGNALLPLMGLHQSSP